MKKIHQIGIQVNEGFTLIELVVVVAVLAILSAIAIPSFNEMQKRSMITVAKSNLISMFKECYLVGGNATFSDISAWNTRNSYGTRGLGVDTNGFTYDTSISSNTPISENDSCLSIAAKSNTGQGSTTPLLPHFEIRYEATTGAVEKNCIVADIARTYNNSSCNTSAPVGSQW